MKDHTNDVQPHRGPPDAEGWWLVSIPTRPPYLLHVGNGQTPDINQAWQDGFKCWALSDVAEVARLPEVLSGIANRPRLLWDLAQVFHHLKLLGPWTEDQDNMGNFEARYEPGGPRGPAKIRHLEDEDAWGCWVGSQRRECSTAAEARQTVDRMLRNQGYFLIDD